MANDNTGTEPEERADCKLFEPFTLRGLTMRNRIWLPPMDTYSVYAQDGKPTPFHYQHYVSRAIGGFGMVIVESTAISPEGRISPCDVGLWNDDQIQAWRWIVDGVKATGARIGVQLNHAGRKGNTGSFHWDTSMRTCRKTRAAGRRSRQVRSRTRNSIRRAN